MRVGLIPLATPRKKLLILKCLPFVLVFTFIWLQFRVENENANGVRIMNRIEYFENSTTSLPFSADVLKELIRRSNERQLILNVKKFGPLLPEEPVIVVQVHNRGQYLLALIDSLKQAKDVEKSLVIFSHDVFDLRLNAIIERIDFCKVLQIFYPFSLQLFPNTFPGTDARDCPRDITREEAVKRKCANAEYPDSYGHYREARYSQTKHHWFWKMNFIVDNLVATRNHTGLYVLLEEDHYVAPDIFHMMRSMNSFRKRDCPQCDFLTMGIYAKSVNYARYGNRIEVHKWVSSRHNMGLVLDKVTWAKIKACAESFCTYDDYNWDWSLQHVSVKCLKTGLNTLTVSAPRVFHIGECGVHHKGKNCAGNSLVKKVDQILRASKQYLFPTHLMFQRVAKRAFKMPKVNGGWSDRRDHMLCLNHVVT